MRSNDEIKTFIEEWKPLQEAHASLPCPRCGRYHMDAEHPVRNALSRYANVYICEYCGIDEAMMDYLGMEPIPFNQWAMARSDEEGEAGNDVS